MTRLQAVLLLVLAALASLFVGPPLWGALVPALGQMADDAPGIVASVPEWVWWTAFGAVWWLPCALGGKSCRTTTSSS